MLLEWVILRGQYTYPESHVPVMFEPYFIFVSSRFHAIEICHYRFEEQDSDQKSLRVLLRIFLEKSRFEGVWKLKFEDG